MAVMTRVKRIAGWFVVAAVVAFAVLLVWGVGSEWSEALVQGFAALGALWYWAHRSRPRVNLRLLHSGGLYLELLNTGNRVAKRVQIKCEPPIPWSETGVTAIGSTERDQFGPIEDFGDMAPDQRHLIIFGTPSPRTAEALDATRFEVSHESTWAIRRRKIAMQFGGSGARASLRDIAATPLGEIEKVLKVHQKELDKIRRSIDALPGRLAAPLGDEP